MSTLMKTAIKGGIDIIKDLAAGKLNESEAVSAYKSQMLSLDEKISDNQTAMNMADAQSADKLRTRWRPLTCAGMAIAFLAYPLTITANATSAERTLRS